MSCRLYTCLFGDLQLLWAASSGGRLIAGSEQHHGNRPSAAAIRQGCNCNVRCCRSSFCLSSLETAPLLPPCTNALRLFGCRCRQLLLLEHTTTRSWLRSLGRAGAHSTYVR